MASHDPTFRSAVGWSRLLERLCLTCAERISITGVSVSIVMRPGVWNPVYASDPVARRLEDLQFEIGEGPSGDALRASQPLLVDDLNAERILLRWPVYAGAALDAGARAQFAYPLRLGAVQLGVLSMYRREPGGLAAGERVVALQVADVMCYTVLGALSGSFRDEELIPTEHSDGRLDRSATELFRAEVPQAAGIIMGQLGISIEEATLRLRAAAFTSNRPLLDVARDIVDRVLRLDDDNGLTGTTGRTDGSAS